MQNLGLFFTVFNSFQDLLVLEEQEVALGFKKYLLLSVIFSTIVSIAYQIPACIQFQGSVNFKFGVLYAKDGQLTDDEMFSNGEHHHYSPVHIINCITN